MLVSLEQVLQMAEKDGYCVPAFNVYNIETARGVINACEELRSPVILQFYSRLVTSKVAEDVAPIVLDLAQRATVPVCFHLDHGAGECEVVRSLRMGMTGIMIDASQEDLEGNIAKTKRIVDVCNYVGVAVEGELGHVGNASVGSISETGADVDPGESLTVPEEVKKFVDITDVDALAVAIGTAHGVYKKTPTLRIDRLDEITAVCDRPLVLHGGSGTPNDQMQNAIKHGITKINIYSDVLFALNQGLKNTLNKVTNPSTWPFIVYEDALKMMKEVVKEKLITFGSANRF
jgi:ketose-bisphosphate aldolase